ncbi:unnamed protein product [Pylaiella littoralis]
MCLSVEQSGSRGVCATHTTSAATEKIGECARINEPVLASQYPSWLQSDSKAAWNGIATNLDMKVAADNG